MLWMVGSQVDLVRQWVSKDTAEQKSLGNSTRKEASSIPYFFLSPDHLYNIAYRATLLCLSLVTPGPCRSAGRRKCWLIWSKKLYNLHPIFQWSERASRSGVKHITLHQYTKELPVINYPTLIIWAENRQPSRIKGWWKTIKADAHAHFTLNCMGWVCHIEKAGCHGRTKPCTAFYALCTDHTLPAMEDFPSA